MIGLIFTLIYAGFFVLSGLDWPYIYSFSTIFLFRWYFISSVLMLLLLLPLAIILSGFLGLLSFAHKTAEIIIAWIGVSMNSARSLLRFFLRRSSYVLGAYYLHTALVFDEAKMPAYSWDKFDLISGIGLLLIPLLATQPIKIKPRKNKPEGGSLGTTVTNNR
ncbi:MAG: hypothetical protein Q8R29_00395 [bacterium]|nr:hypothetical protein [bacterium]